MAGLTVVETKTPSQKADLAWDLLVRHFGGLSAATVRSAFRRLAAGEVDRTDALEMYLTGLLDLLADTDPERYMIAHEASL